MKITLPEISSRLNGRAEQVCELLLPTGKRLNGTWVVGDVTGGNGDSCKIKIEGAYAGHWMDWAEQAMRGDLLDLWQYARGLSRFDAVKQAKDFLGIRDEVNDPFPRTFERVADNPTRKVISEKGRVMHWFATERRLEPKIVNMFRIQGDGENIIFPCYSPEGELVNLSYRTFEKGKKKVWQEKGCPPCLFGWHTLTDETLKSRSILICEGQIDCMTWTQWNIPALSIPNGGGRTWIDYEWDHLEIFDEIFLAFDSDRAGQDNCRQTAKRLGLWRCKIVKMQHKDANDALKSGATIEDAYQWYKAARHIEHESLADVKHYEEKVIEEFYPRADADLGFAPELLNREDGGVRFKNAEVTIWTGTSGHGKTSFITYLMAVAISRGRKVMMASMEMRPAVIIRQMIAANLGMVTPSVSAIRDEIREMSGKLFFADVLGFVGELALFDMMDYAFRRHDVSQIVVDSLMRVSGLDEEYAKQNEFLTKLATFSKQTGTHIHLVAHPRKPQNGSGAPGRMDVKGSVSLLNNCDNLVSLQRNMDKRDMLREGVKWDDVRMMPDCTLFSEKQRDGGWEGKLEFYFHKQTFTFTRYHAEESPSI